MAQNEAEFVTTIKVNEADSNGKKSEQQGNCYWYVLIVQDSCDSDIKTKIVVVERSEI